uniref:Fibronectin type-III domain-containing protein n=1 Tax=Candidatus Kentrum sp. MB TaxID=2138164 RepID=A0A451B953_9GAMM|nr:MAG: hypothetical protein BECKMB1821G_GA0114241_104420 [Candidatus Kentron sp. MB]VFK29555.1 MAG: hypothetical protein BECKMB1821I_GA0114274_101054 [Candidatus Kentron sp. MB]VFK74826.1 MAG: hypothetical protein BECKMB1821H_GA0114242_101054 [Candidatus Kentron sp. MB]
MATFPKKESDVLSLAQEMVAGFKGNTDIYPAPLVSMETLQADVDNYPEVKNAELRARAEWEKAVTAKTEHLRALSNDMRRDIRYAENVVDYDDARLRLIGWGGRKPGKALEPPGQTRELTITGQGEGWISLDWKAPGDGGAQAAYRIESLKHDQEESGWEEAATSTATAETTMVNQERGVRLGFRVVALNKSGDGMVSNTVMATL